MASSQPSVLRQAILGKPPEVSDVSDAGGVMNLEVFPWEKTKDAELGSAVVRAPSTPPIPRAAPGHAGHMKLLFENAPVAMAMFDTNMCYLLANRRWLEDFKLTTTDVTGRSQYELFPTLHPGWRHVYERALSGQVVRSDRDAITMDGRSVIYRWEVRPWRHVDTSIGGVMITCEKLHVPSAMGTGVDHASSGTGEGLWQSEMPLLAMTAEGRIVRSSKGVSRFLRAGTSGGGSQAFWQAFGSAETQELLHRHVLASLNSVLADGRSHAVIFTEGDVTNPIIPSQWLVSRLEGGVHGIPGDLALVIGLPGVSPFSPEAAQRVDSEDRELKNLKKELHRLTASLASASEDTGVARQREVRLRAVLNHVPCGLIVLNDHARAIYHNEHVNALLGRDLQSGASVEEWLGEGARDEIHRAEIARRWSEGVWRKNLAVPIAVTAADGLLKEIEMRPVSLPGGGLLVMVQDVTDSRRGEEMLRSTEAKYRTLVHESPVPIILADRSAAVFDVNPAAESYLGHTRADLRRMPLDSWLDSESLSLRAATLAKMEEHGERNATIKIRVIHRTGEMSPVELRLALVTDVTGQLLFSVHFFTPVTEGHERPIFVPAPAVPTRKTERRLLLRTDVHGRVQEWTQHATDRFGYDGAEVIGRGLHTLFRPSDATGFYADLLSIDMDGHRAEPVDWTFFHKSDGRQGASFLVLRDSDGGLAARFLEEVEVEPPVPVAVDDLPDADTEASPTGDGSSSGQDQPERPAALEPVRLPPPPKPSAEDLSRERLLLGETHHRVKNHLQIITSMLNLQMSTLHNDEARDALRSSQNRVRSIAALHQHLFQLATGSGGDFRVFAGGLIDHLRECYQVNTERVPLQLIVPDRAVPEEWLMPLALSLNEMVSNAFKHAFPDNREGHMRVALSWDDYDGELTVVDDGAGVPANFSHYESSGLGLKILRVFAGQLGGEISIHSAPGQGAVFQLKFPVSSTDSAPAPEDLPED